MSIGNLGVEHLVVDFNSGEQHTAIRHLASSLSSAAAILSSSDVLGASLVEATEWLSQDMERAETQYLTEAMLCLTGITGTLSRKIYKQTDFEPDETNAHQALGVRIGGAIADLDMANSWKVVSRADEAARLAGRPISGGETIGRGVVSAFQLALLHSSAEACDELTYEITAGYTRYAQPEEVTMAVELGLLAECLYPTQVAWNVFPPEDGTPVKLRWAPKELTHPNHKAVIAALKLMEAADSPTITTNRDELGELLAGPVPLGVVAIKPQGIKEVRDHYRIAA